VKKATRKAKKHNTLAVDNPAFLAEWDYENNPGIFPADFTGCSDRKIWWKCRLGHHWETAIKYRTIGTGCPYCAGKKAWPGFNDLATLEPDLSKEWDYENNDGLRPEHFTRRSNKVVWWKCELGHSYAMMINNRTSKRQNCSYCSGHKVLMGFNDLLTTNPSAAKEWDYVKNKGLRPERFTKSAHDKVWWQCKLGHSWKAAIYSRKKHNCPHCHGNALNPGVNDLLTVNPRVAGQWDYAKNDGMRPESVAANAAVYAWWLCEKKHSWRAKVSNRNHGSNCPVCDNKAVLKGFNDLLFIDPNLCKEWDYEKNKEMRPDDVVANSGKYAWWKCKRNHSWRAKIAERRRGAKCPCCAGKVVVFGENDLQTLRPDIADDWDCGKNGGLTPAQVTVQSTQTVWWLCPKHKHNYKAIVYNRTNGTGCPYCAGQLPIVGETDLATVFPDLANEWDYENNKGETPQDFTCGSNKKAHWKCKCGYRWRAQICARTSGTKCPRCHGKTQMRTRFV
jgi:hypothetical protein